MCILCWVLELNHLGLTLSPPPVSCLILGKLPNLFRLQFAYLCQEDDSNMIIYDDWVDMGNKWVNTYKRFYRVTDSKKMLFRAQSYLALCNPTDCSPPSSSVHGILQARIPEWVAISFSRASSWPRGQNCATYISCVGKQILHHCVTWREVKHKCTKEELDHERNRCTILKITIKYYTLTVCVCVSHSVVSNSLWPHGL